MPADTRAKAEQRLAEAVQEFGKAVLARIPGWRDTVHIRTEADKVMADGRYMGLTDVQISEVITAWRTHYEATPWPIDWDKVRAALVRRVRLEQWQPWPGAEFDLDSDTP